MPAPLPLYYDEPGRFPHPPPKPRAKLAPRPDEPGAPPGEDDDEEPKRLKPGDSD